MRGIGSGQHIIEMMCYVDALSDGTNRFKLSLGWGNNAPSIGDPQDGVVFEYSDNIISGNWRCAWYDYGLSSSLDSGVAVAANTWYRLRIVIASDGGSAEFFINGSSVGTITDTIGSSSNMGPVMKIVKSLGTTERSLYVDYYYWKKTVTR